MPGDKRTPRPWLPCGHNDIYKTECWACTNELRAELDAARADIASLCSIASALADDVCRLADLAHEAGRLTSLEHWNEWAEKHRDGAGKEHGR